MIRVLMVHNYYQQRSGEDAVFESEVELLRANGHPVDTLTFHNDGIEDNALGKLKLAASLVHNADSASALERKIRAFNPDVIHIHNLFPVGSPALLSVAAAYGVPVVMTLHNYRLICANALLYRDGEVCQDCVHKTVPMPGIVRGCYRGSCLQTAGLATMTSTHKMLHTWQNKVARYITLTDFARNRILDSSLHLRNEQVVVKSNFMFDPLAKDTDGASRDEKPHALFIGRLSEEKGMDTLLEAFQESGDPIRIIGGGPYEAQVKAAAEVCPNIQYLGFQEKPRIMAELQSAACLVFPSVWFEGFPMTLVEALAMGTPAVVSAIGGLPEIIEDGYNGLHVTPGHPVDVVQQTQRLLQDSNLQKTLAENARQRYLQRYTPDRNYQQLQAIYQSTCQSGSKHVVTETV